MNTSATLLALLTCFAAARADQVPEGDFQLITIGTNSYTNAHLRAYSLTEGSIRHVGGLSKIKLADLPEPARSKFYRGASVEEGEKKKGALAGAEEPAKARTAQARQRRPEELAPSKDMAPNAEIHIGPTTLTIKNADKADWPSINVFVNSDPPFGFGLAIPPLKAGAELRYRLNQFCKPDGLRFDPTSYAVTKVCVGGNGFGYQAYGF